MSYNKNKICKSGLIISFIMAIFLIADTSQSEMGAPTAIIKTVSDGVFQTLNIYPVSGPPDFLPKRREAIKKILDTNFDSVEMAKLALGKYWKPLSDKQRHEFSSLFYWRLYSFYILRIELYSDETVLYKNEKILDDKASVLTRVSSTRYPEFDITYRLRKTDHGWKIYDVVIEGVSLVANYRGQFNNFLSKKNTFNDLLKNLRDKAPDNMVTN
ncbi:MAG: ABC transporter substrate-binding protein [Desulfobulbaceae bacterium]|uniref:ABC transporter substrate-binding protein n=1 Tax=Candidatus Desulfobia pelagia TaxID=2841692 RepID=A0A8J6N9W0_9BACT|nr:ABC transporter substrate-binding protein [Candidatus Desulfobia pelagia]